MTIPIINATIALSSAATQAVNTLTIPPEERLIIVAMGKEFRNSDSGTPLSIPESFRLPGSERANVVLGSENGVVSTVGHYHPSIKKLPAIPIVDRPDGTFEYLSMEQGVRFIIKIVEGKDEFVRALLTPGAHVVYAGHARYGRGPCFGAGDSGLGEMWEEGTGSHPNKDGIFRMGYPFIGIEAEEILEHGYTANLAEAVSKPNAADCDPDLRPHLSELKGRTISEIDPALRRLVRNQDATKKWWSYVTAKKRFVVHSAGWENTLSTPDDIGAITPTCRVFSHLGCSTYKHNYPIVRKLKAWTRAGNERYALFTTNLADFASPHYWLQNLLTFNEPNAFQPLEKSLKYAAATSNKMLNKDRDGCNII
jgi:hypothetical protein